jgi:hypothetical protein
VMPSREAPWGPMPPSRKKPRMMARMPLSTPTTAYVRAANEIWLL